MEKLQQDLQAKESDFTAKYEAATKDGANPTIEQLEELTKLGSELEALQAEAAKATNVKQLNETANTGTETAVAEAEPEIKIEEVEPVNEQTELAASAKTNFAGLSSDKVKEVAKGFLLAPSVPGYKPGYHTTTELARAFDSMQSGQLIRSLRQEQKGTSRHAATLATLQRENANTAHDNETLIAAIDTATNQAKTPKGSLVASGGWCAPSETLYDFLEIPPIDGMISLPEIAVTRGGLKFPKPIDLAKIINETGFGYTEAELIAGVDKPCYEIPCPEWQEVRLDAVGVCITANVLQSKSTPEAVEAYVKALLVAHQYRLNSWTLEKIKTGSTAITAKDTLGAYGSILNTVELAILNLRYRNALPSTQVIEVLIPVWAKSAIRADLAYRTAQTAEWFITDEAIAEHFATRGANVQFINGWAGGLDSKTSEAQYPTKVEFIAYPAGTWLRSLENVLEVGVLYDQAQLKKNKFTQLFTEDAIAVVKRGIASYFYTAPIKVQGGATEDNPQPNPNPQPKNDENKTK